MQMPLFMEKTQEHFEKYFDLQSGVNVGQYSTTHGKYSLWGPTQ